MWSGSVGSTVVRGMSAEQKHKTLGRGPRGLAVLKVPENLCPPKDKFLFSQPMEWQALVSRFDRFSGSFSNKLQTVNERAAWDPWVPFYRIVELITRGDFLPQYRFQCGFPVVSALNLGNDQFG